MHEFAFADATRPQSVACLHLTLMPYSLGHEIILLRDRNPLLTSDWDEFGKLPLVQQLQAIKLAVHACAQTWKQNQQRAKWVRLWNWLARKDDHMLAIADFRNYLAEGRRLPPAPDKEADQIANGDKDGGGRSFGSPLIAQLYSFAIGHLKMTPEAAFDASFAHTAWLYFAHHESEGRYRIENEKEAEIARQMREHIADIAREQAEAKA